MVAKLVYLKNLGSAPNSVYPKRKAQGVRKGKAASKGASQKTKKGSGRSMKFEPKALTFKMVLDVDGSRHKLQTLDARSKTFGHEFGAAFKKSVKKARRENTRVIGRPDLAVTK